MVEVGIHSIKDGTLYRKIRLVVLNISFYQGFLRLNIFREWLWRISVVYFL